jgi:Protein of unknown function (DUF1592)/Protein of unknown function (DUF1588)/Protein of unknown function (DUF1595)/Protein of unknown function (DUF1585)/Protein of unknown function (DUF1587)
MKKLAIFALLAAGCSGVISEPGAGEETPGGLSHRPGGGPGGTGTGAGPGSCAAPGDVLGVQVRRLTRTEYNATVRSLLPGVTLPPIDLPQEIDASGFENRAKLQDPTALLVEQASTGATTIAESAVKNLAGVVSCSATDATCGAKFVESFGARAFRRPLTDAEKKTYTDLFNQQKSAISFSAAVQLTMEALLQAPAFLYRIELGDPSQAALGHVPLTSYEMASRLSYLLWGTMPDQALFDAAKNNQLGTAAEVETQARRMVQDEKVQGAMLEFHRQWLELDRLDREGSKDPMAYPSFTPALKTAIREESDRFIGDVMTKGDASLKALLTSPSTFVNSDLAKLYGAAAPASGWGPVVLKAGERAGILTRANFLASHAHSLSGSPPLRAVFIMRRLMCTTLPPPPADADTSPPKPDPSGVAQTNRQLFEARTVGACLGCHGTINPIGFGLENYDAIGGYRTTDNGLPVNAQGMLGDIDGAGPFNGGIELSQKLADSAQVRLCMTGQWYEYALGRDRDASDDCKIDALDKALAAAGGNIREMLVALTKTDDFMFRRAP